MTGTESDLVALRQAATNRDHEQIQFLLKRLVLRLPFYHALVIAVEQAHGYVGTFERYHPDAVWARQVLVHIATVGTTPGDLPDEAMHDYTTPGSANFVKAVFDLGNAAFQEHPMEARIGFLVSAVVHAIMAELVEVWYGARLADWERVRQNPNAPEAAQIALRFWTDEAISQRDTEAWLNVADRIEQHVNRV
jgi:hypothetical protein